MGQQAVDGLQCLMRKSLDAGHALRQKSTIDEDASHTELVIESWERANEAIVRQETLGRLICFYSSLISRFIFCSYRTPHA